MLEFFTPTFIIAVLVSLSVHEWAHGFVAYKLGDPTAKYEGRLTLNPISHLDPIGTLLFLVVGFGWGKPVPVNPQYFKNHNKDTALVAIAGPLSNFIMAITAFSILMVVGKGSFLFYGGGANASVLTTMLSTLSQDFIRINLILMAFNLLPIAPLDGSKVIRAFIPYKYEREYLEFMARGPQILLILVLASMFLNIPIFSVWIGLIISPILNIFALMAGIG